MGKRLLLLVQLVVLAVLTIAFIRPGQSLAITNTQLPLSSSGSQANLATSGFSITPDGRYVVFTSNASYLVSGDTNGKQDVFVRDTVSGTTTRVSVSSGGTEANNDSSGGPIITRNGKYVLFNSSASNLATVTGVPAGEFYNSGMYLHDMDTGTTTLVGLTYSNGAGTGNQTAYPDALSEDARFIYYNKLSGSGADGWRVFVKDRALNTDNEVSTDASGTPATSGNTSQAASTSCDGRWVAFQSSASNLVAGDTNSQYDLFLVDTMGQHAIQDITLGGNNTTYNGQVTCDGNWVLFDSTASNLVGGDTNNTTDGFKYSIARGTLERVTLDNSSAQMSNGGNVGGMSEDGKYITFESAVTTSGVTHGQIFVRNTAADTTQMLSQSAGTPGDCDSAHQKITFDGGQVMFISCATNLGVSNPTNNWYLYRSTGY